MRMSDWSSDVCSSDLVPASAERIDHVAAARLDMEDIEQHPHGRAVDGLRDGVGIGDIGEQQHRIVASVASLQADHPPCALSHGAAPLKIGRASCRDTVGQYV